MRKYRVRFKDGEQRIIKENEKIDKEIICIKKVKR